MAWDRRIARAVCVVLSLLGLLPFLATMVVRSSWARAWAARETQRLLAAQGIAATYAPSLRVSPLSVELDRVIVQSTDGGAPALVSNRVLVRPKVFALLAGKLAIDGIDVDAPQIRAVVRGSKVANLSLPQQPGTGGPIHAPFTTFSMTDGVVDLDIDGIVVHARSLDVDVTADDDRRVGSSFDIAVRASDAKIHRWRTSGHARVSDDDAICSLETRGRIEPDSVVVRRFDAVAVADFDPSEAAPPPCDPGDQRRVELSLGHVAVRWPRSGSPWPAVSGHVHVRAPVVLAARVAPLPDIDGWVGADVDVRYAADTAIPDLNGTLEAHGIRVAQYAFAQELHSELTVRRNVVRSPKTTVRLANGMVTLTDTVVEPLAAGVRLERTRLDASGVDFTTLLRNLGVHPSSWVGWDIREIHAPLLTGTLAPLKIDGELAAKTGVFGVYDRPAEDPARERLFGFSEAQVSAHLTIHPDAIKFFDLHASLPHSHADGGFVSLGFHNDLRVEVPRLHADLDDISPVGPVPMHGILEASAHVGGVFQRPLPQGDVKSAIGLVVASVAFGDLSAGHISVDVDKPELDLSDVRARRGESPYEVSTGRLSFRGGRGFVVDARASSDKLRLRDFLSMFSLETDPRFDGLEAEIATGADVHVAVGGPEDACASGFVAVGARSHLRNVEIYGEQFAKGDADVVLKWFDRDQGLAGADIDVRSFVLDKVQTATGTRIGATGTVVGSATIRRGGALAANVAIEGVPLGRIDALGTLQHDVEGRVSGIAHVTGTVDDFSPDAGFTVRAGVDVSGTRVRDVALADSHLDVMMTHRMPRPTRSTGRSRCGALLAPPFDRAAYLADTSTHGEWTVNGSLLGGQLNLSQVVLTRARQPRITGRASLRGLDAGALARIVSPPSRSEAGDSLAGRQAHAIGGQIWGELIVDDGWVDSPSKSRARLFLGPTIVSRDRQTVTLQPPRDPLVLADDALSVPTLEVVLDTQGGFRGGFQISGHVSRVTTRPTLAIEARIEPVDLAVLQKIVPSIERASGRLDGNVHIDGEARSPDISGEVHAIGDEIEVRGLPSALSELRLDVQASSNQLTASGTGKFAGGTIAAHAAIPVRGFDLGPLESRIALQGLRLNPEDGVVASVDGDLRVAYDPKAEGVAAALPHVTGDVTIDSLSYTRPITFNLDLTSAHAKRTLVNAYDPSLDFVVFSVGIKSRIPVVIKNNLIEVQLAIDSGVIQASGTNQRVGLRGALRALPGGRFHFQGNDFDVQQALIRFDDPTRVDPNVDITAVTEYRQYSDTSAGTSTGATTGGGPSAQSAGSTRSGSQWRITMHAYGDADNVHVELTSEPALSQDDIVLLLAVGMTRAELDQLQTTGIGGIGESVALNVIGEATGANRAVKQAIPIIDDFRFGSAYSTVTGKTEPQLTIGKRLTNDLRASVQAGLTEDRELRANIEWRLNNRLSIQGSYDNINDVSSSALGNLGVDLRWRLDFE
ncbi:MAG TPA: translocation/assembly module TamB domain-containing protein [Polyangiaceae bacterium]|nr:translocation/assembly module TamB domain-containing protein [Polyangiaceae bacterium]